MNVVRVFIGTCLRRGYGACTRLPRQLVRLYAALVFLLAAGTMAVLMAAAAVTLKATLDPWGAIVLAAAAMWIPQQLITAARYRRP